MATKTAPKAKAPRRKTAAEAPSGSKTRKKPSASKRKKPQFTSRGVTRPVEAGSAVECAYCGERVKFRAKIRQYQVICNVYEKKQWDRVEHYHDECYVKADSPYGPPEE